MHKIIVAAVLAALAVTAVSEAAGTGPVTAAKRVIDPKARKDARKAIRVARHAQEAVDLSNRDQPIKDLERRVETAEQRADSAAARTYGLNVGTFPNGPLATVTSSISIFQGSRDHTHADCPDGSSVVGGGFRLEPAPSGFSGAVVYAQAIAGNGYDVAADNSRSAKPVTLTVEAYCIAGLRAQ